MSLNLEMAELVVACISLIIWLARLEFRQNKSEKDIESLRESHDNLSVELRGELSSINKSLARIEGKLSAEKKQRET